VYSNLFEDIENIEVYEVKCSQTIAEGKAIILFFSHDLCPVCKPSGFVFLDSDGEVLEDEKFYGYNTAPEFYDTLDLIAE